MYIIVYRLVMYVLNTRNCTLHYFYPIGHAIRFNLYMQGVGYVHVDLKSNNCFKIPDFSLVTQIQITTFLFKLMYHSFRKMIHIPTINKAIKHFYCMKF